MKHYFSIKHFLLNTSSLFWTAFKTWLNTDWLTQQAFISDIPSSQMHSSPTTDNSVSSFNFYVIFVLSTGNKVLANSLLYQGCLIHIYLQDVPHFDSLTLSNTFLCNFLLVFCFGWQLLHSCFLLFISTGQVIGLMCICIFILGFSVEILPFGFFLVNSECDAYLPVDHSLVRGHSKMFLLFFSLILSLI